jgi:hypothetical protein
MNVLHITPHMGDGDGMGKAISGIAHLGQQAGDNPSILLLDEPRKFHHKLSS